MNKEVTNKMNNARAAIVGAIVKNELSHSQAQEVLKDAEKTLADRSYHISVEIKNVTR